jgi:hypothetical protein
MKGKSMNKNLKILMLFTVLLAAASLTALTIACLNDRTNQSAYPFGPRSYFPNPADLDFYYVARTVFSTINIVLLIVLIVNYVSIFLKTRSEFTIGLILFSVFFLMKDITWSPFIVRFAGFDVFGLGPFAFLPDLFELIALSVLLYLSIEY